jgi:hypothetical protein
LKNPDKMRLKERLRQLKWTEKLMIVLLIIALIAAAMRWDTIKEGFVKGWELFSIEKWYDKD